ncbi:helix-turn-helix transcriptional regulator [Symbioplanes lichenis]|uniref:helix-turn-helix transcriptional regulator n=1 Tax=Symbioplanes lichenis TaxID=1629072 RepID=UPI00273960ED|nr:LuxR family transcriptional regulator [Actinoplanes lichenis]
MGAGQTFGRDRELTTLRHVLSDTAAGAGGCLVLRGQAGVGKSHLLRTTVTMAGELGVATAAREALKLDLAAPLVTLAAALRSCTVGAPEFEWLFESPRSEKPFLTIDRLRTALEDFAARQPLLIVIDDAQWMDEVSALAVRELVPALASTPVRWLLAVRPGHDTTLSTRILDRLAAASAIDVPRLGEEAIAQLSAKVLGADVDNTVLALAGNCGGLPLRVTQLMRALRVGNQVLTQAGRVTVTGDELPSSFVEAVQSVLASLSPGARWLVRATSVLDRPFDISTAGRLTGRPDTSLFPLVREVSDDFLSEDGGVLTFTHDLVRQAVQSKLSLRARERLHRIAADIARDEHRPAPEIAGHLLRSGPGDAGEAAMMLSTAAREIAVAAPATAADLMVHALETLDAQDPRRTALVAEAVSLLASAARLAHARALGEQALAAGLTAETEARLLLGLAEACKHAGHNKTAEEYADRALALDAITTGTRASLHAIRAHARVYSGNLAGADTDGAEADELGRNSSEYAAAVFGLTARSLAAHTEGRTGDALAHAVTATRLADQFGGHARHRHPRIWLAAAQTATDDFAGARDTLLHGHREADALGTAWDKPLWHYYRAALLTALGSLDEAAAEAEAGVEVAERLTAFQLAVPLLGALSRTSVLRGDLAAADQQLIHMRSLIATGITAAPEDVAWSEATYLHATGQDDAAYELLKDLYEALPDRLALLVQDPGTAATLVGMALTAGDRRRAAAVAHAAHILARRNPASHSAAGAAAHAAGLLHGDVARLRRAASEFRRAGRRLAMAAALHDAAVVGSGSENPARVETWFDEALSVVITCGADGARHRFEHARGSWRTTAPSAATGTPIFSPELSSAELRVARLVADGLTNSQVAQALFIPRSTVDGHLRRIFVKLDISRRVELVGGAASRQLLP